MFVLEGMGYAKEALRLLLGFGFGRLKLDRMYARTFKTNERSISLLGSLGFSKSPDFASEDEFEYSIFKNDYVDKVVLEIED